MILPTESAHDRQPLVCGDASGSGDEWILPLRSGVPPILGVSAALGAEAKRLFVASNVAYLAVALSTLSGAAPVVPAQPALSCCVSLCASSLFHGSLVALIAAVSSFWHGAQCQILPLVESAGLGIGCNLHSPRWLHRLIKADIACSLSVFACSIVCFGAARTVGWMAGPFIFFIFGRRAKRRREYCAYAAWHGAWHVLSALAISQIIVGRTLQVP